MTTLKPQIGAHHAQDEELARLRAEVAEWRARFAASKTRDLAFVNSGGEIPALFTQLDIAGDTDASLPGAFPYTRGIHPTGYRGRLWTMRQFAGSAAHTTRTRATSSSSSTARRDSPSPSTSRRSWVTTRITHGRKARWGSAASQFRVSPTWRRCLRAFRSTRSPRR